MTKTEENLEEALQLLLKLSNKPHFMYVGEVKEIAGLVHAAAQFKTPPALSEDILYQAYKAGFYQDSIHGKSGSQDENLRFNEYLSALSLPSVKNDAVEINNEVKPYALVGEFKAFVFGENVNQQFLEEFDYYFQKFIKFKLKS